MKFEGDALQQRLRDQAATVVLVDVEGCERANVSARYAAGYIAGRRYVGYGKNGVVLSVVSVDAPKRLPMYLSLRPGPLAPCLLAAVQNIKPCGKHNPDRMTWEQRPEFSNTGNAGAIETVHVGRHWRKGAAGTRYSLG